MTYRDRSDGLVVESDRKKNITFKFTCHLRDLQGYCVYKSGFFFPFPLGSASPQSPLWTSCPRLFTYSYSPTYSYSVLTYIEQRRGEERRGMDRGGEERRGEERRREERGEERRGGGGERRRRRGGEEE